MDYHHVIEAAGVVSLGLVLYSYLIRWFDRAPGGWRRWRPLAVGVAFGAVAVTLMISRIHVGHERYVDARAVPIALVTLVEGVEAGSVTAAIAALYRISRGGTGAPAGVLQIVATAAAAAAVRRWARRDRRVGKRHVLTLVVAVWAITGASFLVLGARGVGMFEPLWLDFFVLSAIGVGAGAVLFGDVVNSQAAETARREAAELRVAALLARAAAHEINNPLTAVLGGLALVQRSLRPGSEETKWVANATAGAEQIRDIVKHMNRFTQVAEVPPAGSLPPMLDIRKSGAPS
ncbi:MAG TPA: LytS/YhcK type 5TM receptor domain-containing protein [Methylomirabilota bacterium]|nr:LytS/YhcK type 5TM receptor domain-containing protein [Methylomirabilota bacterium]